MRFGSSDLQGVLLESFDSHWVADLYYNGSRVLQDVPVSRPSFREDAQAKVQQSGSVTVEWSDEFATSILPVDVSSPLAPFGAQLWVYSVVEAGEFSERVEYGRFEITDVPSGRDEQMVFRGELITLGSRVELELRELLHGVAQESFDVPSAPSQLDSTWAELAVITGLPLERTVDDVAVNRSIMYPDNKLDAVHELMDVMLDADPHMTADGSLSARPRVWPDPVDTLTMDGALVGVGHRMSADQVYNRVVVRATSGEQSSVLAVAELTSGPLRVRNPDGSVSPFRARTKFLSSEFVTTAGQAQAWADSTLTQVAALRSRVVPVVEKFNPLRERGDVVLIERPNLYLVARVVTISRSGHTQELTVEVGGTLPRTVPVGPFDGFYAAHGLFPSDELFPDDELFPEW